jgi:predicted O-methyltransferase YrrM
MPAEFDIVAAENRRLVREVKELRARVDAVESSRWWRLHPRLLLRRLRTHDVGRNGNEDAAPPNAEREASSTPEDELTARFRAEVVARGSFRSDMVSGNFALWEPIMGELEGRSARILEIGSFEGMSACYFLWRLRDAHVTCIDTFAGGRSFAALGSDVSGLEVAFDRNVALVDGSRVRKLAGTSTEHLPILLREGKTFDLVFIDGSDLALDVLVDAALSWQLLESDGYLIFDNYVWRSPLGEDPLFHPAPAVDAFLNLVGDHCEVSFEAQEVIVRRVDAPVAEPAPS